MSTEKPIDTQKLPPAGADHEEVLAVLFADLCDSTRLYHDLGDAAAHALAAQCLTLIGEVTVRTGGTVVKTIGDGAMTTFPTADMAYQAAMEIQDALRGGHLRIKIGFHIGPVLVADGDVFGDTVNLAARVLARSGPGEILLTGACLETIRPDYRSSVSLLDTTAVKGRPDPIEIYRVILRASLARESPSGSHAQPLSTPAAIRIDKDLRISRKPRGAVDGIARQVAEAT